MEAPNMNAFRSIYRAVRSFLPSQKKERQLLARRFARAIRRKAPATDAPGLWPWAARTA
jgi:hypothetical protein